MSFHAKGGTNAALMNPFSCVLTNPAINVQSSIQKAANKYI